MALSQGEEKMTGSEASMANPFGSLTSMRMIIMSAESILASNPQPCRSITTSEIFNQSTMVLRALFPIRRLVIAQAQARLFRAAAVPTPPAYSFVCVRERGLISQEEALHLRVSLRSQISWKGPFFTVILLWVQVFT